MRNGDKKICYLFENYDMIIHIGIWYFAIDIQSIIRMNIDFKILIGN